MTKPPGHMNEIVRELCRLSEKAGHEAMRFYKGQVSVDVNNDSSPLTDADRASHDLLMRFLPGVIPGVPVISEESETSAHHSTHGADRFWLVDPVLSENSNEPKLVENRALGTQTWRVFSDEMLAGAAKNLLRG